MENLKLSVKALALTSGILWSAALLIVGVLHLLFPGYGAAFLKAIGSIYFHPTEITSIFSVMGLSFIAFIDGAAAGICFAWIYNFFVGQCSKEN